MKKSYKSILALFSVALLAGVWINVQVARADNDPDDGHKITVLDACDPNDPGWGPTGGCFLRGGTVSLAEFGSLLFSVPVNGKGGGILVGHPAWRNQPSYLTIRAGKPIQVSNQGGRTHSFTEVANFGGGVVPPLNDGLVQAPECSAQVPLTAGNRISVAGLAKGVHQFQCCIHPWMRATVRVE
jgi:plastocyanin